MQKDKPLAAYYLNKLSSSTNSFSDSTIESVETSAPDLSREGIADRLNSAKEELYRIVKEYLDDKKELYEIADKIVVEGEDLLVAVRDDDDKFLANRKDAAALLEVIVRTDGSRPSFLIRNGEVDKSSSPAGAWANILDADGGMLKDAISCVGRINLAGTHIGTGFLVHNNFIITNRHVMQVVAQKDIRGKWVIKGNAAIDFGHEYRARTSVNPRKLKQIVFCGKQDIDGNHIDHSKLDLALIELQPAPTEFIPVNVLGIDISTEWATPDSATNTYIIGYPANPGIAGLSVYGTLLEQLFFSTFGYKRLAPGVVMASTASKQDWTMAHDTTTLGGNSGSPILRIGRENTVAGLHYGGTTKAPRENWGHILGKTINTTDIGSANTLKQVLIEKGIRLVDNF